MDAPSKLVGWFSRVFTYGFRYYNDDALSSMKILKEVNFLIGTGSSFKDLKADGKIDAIKTIFSNDRINDKAENINFYFFSETSHDKITDELDSLGYKYNFCIFEFKHNLYIHNNRTIIMSIYNIDGETLTPIKQVKFKNERELQNLTEKT